jgi:hypothetical protein
MILLGGQLFGFGAPNVLGRLVDIPEHLQTRDPSDAQIGMIGPAEDIQEITCGQKKRDRCSAVIGKKRPACRQEFP